MASVDEALSACQFERSRITRLMVGVVAAALVLGACGAEFEVESVAIPTTETSTTTTSEPNPEPEPGVGSFSASVAPTVVVGDEFAVVVADIVGGEVSASSGSSGCEHLDGLRFLATEPGPCRLTVSQADTDGYAGAEAQVFETVLELEEVDPLPRGSFNLRAPAESPVGESFQVVVDGVVGGPVALRSRTEVCTLSGDTVVATKVGVCLIQATQGSSTTHSSGHRRVVEVAIVERPPVDQATFLLSAPSSTRSGDQFTVEAEQLVGIDGSVTLTATGDCEVVDSGTNSLTLLASKSGACAVDASALPANGFLPPSPQSTSITVLRMLGSFDIDAPSSIELFQQLSVVPVNVVGGQVTVTLVDEVCDWDSPYYYGNSVGTCNFVATQDDDPDYEPAAPRPIAVQVTKKVPVVTIDAPAVVQTDESFDVTATSTACPIYAGGSPACEITITVSPGCTYDDYDGYVAPSTAGTCTVTAEHPGSDRYTAGLARHTITVEGPPPVKAPGLLSIAAPGTVSPSTQTVVVTFAGGIPRLRSTDSDTCFVDSGPSVDDDDAYFDVRFVSQGTCVLRTSHDETDTHTAHPGTSVNIEVFEVVESVPPSEDEDPPGDEGSNDGVSPDDL